MLKSPQSTSLIMSPLPAQIEVTKTREELDICYLTEIDAVSRVVLHNQQTTRRAGRGSNSSKHGRR